MHVFTLYVTNLKFTFWYRYLLYKYHIMFIIISIIFYLYLCSLSVPNKPTFYLLLNYPYSRLITNVQTIEDTCWIYDASTRIHINSATLRRQYLIGTNLRPTNTSAKVFYLIAEFILLSPNSELARDHCKD